MKESIEPDVHQLIRTIRGHRIILDTDLARIYGVPTFRLNEAVKRNRRRFPEDFLFQLTAEEHAALTSQIAMSKPGRGGRRTRPYAFTEHGALQVANVLNSSKAEAMSIYVIRAFIRMREELSANQAVSKRLAEIERTLLTHDAALRDLYQKIRPLLLPPPDKPKRRIGFRTDD
jgi:ORF6N domain